MATTNNWFLRDDEGSNTWASLQVEETSPYADNTEVVYQVYDFQAVYADSAQIYYDVDSDIGQVIGGGTFPFASVTTDAEVIYQVLNSAAQNDLAVSYSTRQGIDTQLYALWDVLTGVEVSSVEFTYGMGGYAEADMDSAFYVVYGGVEKDLASVAYDVVGEVLADKVVTYNTTTTPLTATNIVTSTWDITSTAEGDLACSNTVLTGVEQDKEVVYYVFGEVLKDTAQEYDIPGTVDASSPVVTYDLFGYVAVEKDYTFSYQISSDIVIVPNVLGMPLSLATSTIQGTGLTIGTVTYVTLQ